MLCLSKHVMTMMGGLPSQILYKAVFIFCLSNGVGASKVTGSSCQQIFMKPPRMGQRCITDTEVYRNHTVVLNERCMWHCLRDPSCAVINYNIAESSCLLGHAPCVSLEPEREFITIPMTMQDPCLGWMRQDAIPPPDDMFDIINYPVGSNPQNSIVVARAISGFVKIQQF